MSNQNRVSRGVPTGGQFAASSRGESAGVTLGSTPAASPRIQAREDALDEYARVYAEAHADGYISPSQPGDGLGVEWTTRLAPLRGQFEDAHDEAEIYGEYGPAVEEARLAFDAAEADAPERGSTIAPAHARKVRNRKMALNEARRDAGIVEPDRLVREVEANIRAGLPAR